MSLADEARALTHVRGGAFLRKTLSLFFDGLLFCTCFRLADLSRYFDVRVPLYVVACRILDVVAMGNNDVELASAAIEIRKHYSHSGNERKGVRG